VDEKQLIDALYHLDRIATALESIARKNDTDFKPRFEASERRAEALRKFNAGQLRTHGSRQGQTNTPEPEDSKDRD